MELIKVQLQPLLALAQADPAVRPNDSFGHVFHPNILQIHPRSFTFGGHFEVGEVVVAPVDPIEDGEPPQSLGRPKSELSPGWNDAFPGPADEEKKQGDEFSMTEILRMIVPMFCVSNPVPGSTTIEVGLVERGGA